MTPARYTTLLLDLDHTLLDSDESERLAFDATMRLAGVTDPAALLPAYVAINRALWAEVEAGTVTAAFVRVARFERLVAGTGLDADPVALADAFTSGLGAHGDLYTGAREVLDRLAGRVRLGLVTNGLADVQLARLERLGIAELFDTVVVSSAVGHAKPAPAIFDIALERLGSPTRSTVVMVGDSLSSDVRGGRRAGLATCWYNRHRTPPASLEDPFDHEIHEHAELLALAGLD